MTVATAPRTIGDLEFDEECCTLTGPRGHIHLNPQMCSIAERLLRRPDVIVETSDLIGTLYPDADGEPETALTVLRSRIMQLRTTIHVLSRGKVRIETERSIGYKARVVR